MKAAKAKKSYNKGGKISNELYEDPFSEIENRNKTTGSKVSSNSGGRKFSSNSAKNLTAGYGAGSKRRSSSTSLAKKSTPAKSTGSTGLVAQKRPITKGSTGSIGSTGSARPSTKARLNKGGRVVAQGADRADKRADRKAFRAQKQSDRKEARQETKNKKKFAKVIKKAFKK